MNVADKKIVIFIMNENTRPKNWPERLCSSCATFDTSTTFKYSPLVTPIIFKGQRCVKIYIEEIKQKYPLMFEYLMWFKKFHNINEIKNIIF